MASDEEPPITAAQLLKAVVEGAVDEVKKMLDPGLSESHKKFNATNPLLTCKDPKTGFPPLMLAAINGRAKMCELLIVKKAALDCADERGDSPLHRAAVQSDLPVIEALIARGMPVDVRSKSGLTPLHHAATRGDTGVSKLLLNLGASPNVQDDAFGSTPLHFAAIEGHTLLGDILIDKGARLDLVTSFGDTPLHDAAGYGQADFCQMLLRRGANRHVMAKKGDTPLQYARTRGYPACVALIEEAEAKLAAQDMASSAHEAVERLSTERVTNDRDRKAAQANAKAKAQRERAMAEHRMQIEELNATLQEATPKSEAAAVDRATAEPIESEVVPPSDATTSEPDVAEPAGDDTATPRRCSSGAASPSIGAPSTGSLPASPRSTGVASDVGPARSPRPAQDEDEPVESASPEASPEASAKPSPEASPEASPMASPKAITPTASPRQPESPTDVQ